MYFYTLRKIVKIVIEYGLNILDIKIKGFRSIDFVVLDDYLNIIAFLLRNIYVYSYNSVMKVIEYIVINYSPDIV